MIKYELWIQLCLFNFVSLHIYFGLYFMYSCSYNIYIHIHSYSSYRILNTQVILVNYNLSISVWLTYKRNRNWNQIACYITPQCEWLQVVWPGYKPTTQKKIDIDTFLISCLALMLSALGLLALLLCFASICLWSYFNSQQCLLLV